MSLHGMRVTCLRQDFKQLVIGEEVETRECSSLHLQIILHLLLDFLQLFVVLLEFPQKVLTTAALVNQGSLVGFQHSVLPEFINDDELFILVWQLFLDVFSTENVLQIHPLPLASEPLVNNFRDQH